MCADVRSRVESLADRYWQTWIEAHPVAATASGEHAFDDRMPDVSRSFELALRDRLSGLLAEAEAGTDTDLQPADDVTLAALRSQLDGDLAEIDADLRAWSVDPIDGPQIEIFNVESFQPAATPRDGRAIVSRWRDMGRYLDQHAANLRSALADGRVAVRTPVAHVIEALDDVLAQSDDAWPLLAPAQAPHPDWPTTDLAAFRADLAAAVANEVRPALARLRATLHDEILPAARPDERPGLMHVRGGADAYPRLIRLHTSLDLAPETLHRIGIDEIARINGELAALGARVLGTADQAEILRRLRGDPALYFRTPDEVAEKAATALARATVAIPKWFGVLPEAPCVVVRMGDHEAKHGTIAYYRQPDPDGSRPGQYYINATEPETRPRYEAEALAYHESIPGHHLQIARAQEVRGLPAFRRHLGVTAFWEGWGLYAERLSDEMGLYSGDLDRIGILSFDAWRACRLVVDTGMHALGWTRQQAIDYMLANSALAPNNIANEVDRYITWPGQALAYKIGQLELLRLRADVRDRLGSAFDIRRFHDAVLENGAIGLVPLREVVTGKLAGPTAH
jgi:uncharacterized protein (DUF885 family)